jgi:hypothetical protein
MVPSLSVAGGFRLAAGGNQNLEKDNWVNPLPTSIALSLFGVALLKKATK